jgi:hypothetical protein
MTNPHRKCNHTVNGYNLETMRTGTMSSHVTRSGKPPFLRELVLLVASPKIVLWLHWEQSKDLSSSSDWTIKSARENGGIGMKPSPYSDWTVNQHVRYMTEQGTMANRKAYCLVRWTTIKKLRNVPQLFEPYSSNCQPWIEDNTVWQAMWHRSQTLRSWWPSFQTNQNHST